MGHGIHEVETQRANYVIYYFQEVKNNIRRETAYFKFMGPCIVNQYQ